MRRIATIALGAVVAFAGAAPAQPADPARAEGIVRAGAATLTAGPAAFFTGQVSVVQLVVPQSPARTALGLVTFQPGARSRWHTHPAGQSFYVTEGCGWTQREGGPVERVFAGDTVTVPAGVRHWHGATATTAMAHLAVTETIDGKNVTWLDPVSDQQYAGPSAP